MPNKHRHRVTVWFERDPEEDYPVWMVEEKWFRTILIRKFDYFSRGVSKKRLKRLMEIKELWERGEGEFNSEYYPSPDFRDLGKPLIGP